MATALMREQQRGHDVQLRVAAEVAHRGRERRQHDRLPRERRDVGGDAAPPQQDDAAEQHPARPQHRDLREHTLHASTSARTTKPRPAAPGRTRPPAVRARGTDGAWRRAFRGRRRPRPAPPVSPPCVANAIASAAGVSDVASPHGTNRLPASSRNTNSLSHDAHSTSARYGPGVLEDHRFVDHRELEMRRRVVHRQPAGLRQHHDEQRHEGQDVAGAERGCRAGDGAGRDLAQVRRARRPAPATGSPARWPAR